MDFNSINPFTGKIIETHVAHSTADVNGILHKSEETFTHWRKVQIQDRVKLLKNAASLLRKNTEVYARMITLEMGKPIIEARAEVLKCALVCDYYAENAEVFLAPETIVTDARSSYVRHDPIGAVLAIMPWNFPFWQVFRFAAPTLTAGNVAILKHAANVFGCAKMIESLFLEAGYPQGVFQNLIVGHDLTESIISHEAVKAVTLTGSGRAGSTVASIAGKYLKKSLLELGGSNSFIVFKDADIDKAVQTAVTARMLNGGQSCIAAKRFILMEGIYEEFVTKFIKEIKELKSGDPMLEETQIGTLARKDLAEELNRQVVSSVTAGAKLLLGGDMNECYHEPTVLGEVKPGMAAFDQETFGPLAAMIKVRTEGEALHMSELSRYGLGVTLCTTNMDKALKMSEQVSDGAFFVNEIVKSDSRLPFGGTKASGYGRELSRDGMLDFVNRKTIYIN